MRNDRRVLIAIVGTLALSGAVSCSGPAGPANNQVAAAPSGGPPQTDTLTGLYEGATQQRANGRRDQMCMIERDGRASFGLVTWGSGDTNCSGSGIAQRDGSRLRLQMEGDESCTIEAQMDGTRLVLPAQVPAGCAYYCGPGARLTGAQFDKTGGTNGDAARAVDLVGDPLCGDGS